MKAKFMADIKIIDSHVHLTCLEDLPKMAGIMEGNGLHAANAACLPDLKEKWIPQNLLGLLFKAMYPGRAYSFGALHYPHGKQVSDGRLFEEQAAKIKRLGFDGVKMLEGKPSERKRTGLSLCSPVYHGFYRFMEAEGFPILFHVGDPADFWDRDRAPDWAVENGWAYLDGSFVSKGSLYTEVDTVLKMFPGLKIIFAHFYFMAEEGLKRASDFLDRWPGVSFDLTPGGEMYPCFSARIDKWRDFFIKYQDRILFGTDNDYGEAAAIIHDVRTFLETEQGPVLWGENLRGLSLDRPVLEKVYSLNFCRYAGNKPAEASLDNIAEELGEVLHSAGRSSIKGKLLKEIARITEAFGKIPPL